MNPIKLAIAAAFLGILATSGASAACSWTQPSSDATVEAPTIIIKPGDAHTS